MIQQYAAVGGDWRASTLYSEFEGVWGGLLCIRILKRADDVSFLIHPLILELLVIFSSNPAGSLLCWCLSDTAAESTTALQSLLEAVGVAPTSGTQLNYEQYSPKGEQTVLVTAISGRAAVFWGARGHQWLNYYIESPLNAGHDKEGHTQGSQFLLVIDTIWLCPLVILGIIRRLYWKSHRPR